MTYSSPYKTAAPTFPSSLSQQPHFKTTCYALPARYVYVHILNTNVPMYFLFNSIPHLVNCMPLTHFSSFKATHSPTSTNHNITSNYYTSHFYNHFTCHRPPTPHSVLQSPHSSTPHSSPSYPTHCTQPQTHLANFYNRFTSISSLVYTLQHILDSNFILLQSVPQLPLSTPLSHSSQYKTAALTFPSSTHSSPSHPTHCSPPQTHLANFYNQFTSISSLVYTSQHILQSKFIILQSIPNLPRSIPMSHSSQYKTAAPKFASSSS